MVKRLFLAAALLICLVFDPLANAAEYLPNGLARLQNAPANAIGTYDGVATFGGAMPSAAQLDALRSLGLTVQGFNNLPLAMLRGPKAALIDAVRRGIVEDVYPNDKLTYFSAPSDISIKADQVQAMGIDGSGVAVAIVDSGIDATHPDLAKRVKSNVKMIDVIGSVSTPAGSTTVPPIIVPVDQGPYSNSDTSSGHGTHVAGIVAADNTDGQVLGVAPGADLLGYGCGDTVFVFNVLTSYDDIIAKKTRALNPVNVRAVNNSWGSSFRLFDPDEPINQATRVLHGKGIAVVFAAGNAATEMSLNPYSAAPWVISVGAGALNKLRADFSSGGLEFDNAVLVEDLGTNQVKHLAFSGDRIGLYHPSISTPGVNILSTGTTGVAVTALPGGTASASGTSMASPHVAGLVALITQKNPTLTPDEVKQVLEATSDLIPSLTDVSKVDPFFHSGYGWGNAKAAVDLVGRTRYKKNTSSVLLSARDRAVLGDRDYSVLKTDYWTYAAPYVSLAGLPETPVFTFEVTSSTKAIKALVSYPSLGYVGQNPFNYQLTLKDAAGKIVATTAPAADAGMSFAFVDLAQVSGVQFGTWTVEVYGETGTQDGDTLMGNLISVAIHQLSPQKRTPQKMPAFTASGTASYYLRAGDRSLVPSTEGCDQQAGAPVARLSATRAAGTEQCQSGNVGYVVNYGAGIPADFTAAVGEKLAAPMTVGGTASFKWYLIDPASTAWMAAQSPFMEVEIDAVDDAGNLVLPVAAAQVKICSTVNGARVCNTDAKGGVYTFSVPPVTIPAGLRLSVRVYQAQLVTSTARTVYGGKGLAADFSDAGITFTTGTLQ